VSGVTDSSFQTGVHLQRSVQGAAKAEVRFLTSCERTVVWVDIDPSYHRGALSAEASGVIANAATTALNQRIPLVLAMASSGADILGGIAALHGWGQAARAIAHCSGVVPTFTIVTGPAVSGPALLIGLSDFVIMTADSYAFVSGPTMVAEFTGITMTNEQLGGTDAHAKQSGVASMVVADYESAVSSLEHLLTYIPNNVDELAPPIHTGDASDRLVPEAGAVIPDTATGSYDVRKVIKAIADDGEMFELRERWAANVVTAFITIDGESVGVVANQPMILAGTLDIPASQKAARFVSFCDAFNIPLLTLVDTPGFYPGKDLEWRGMIRHGGQLVFAYARATVPRVCVILRKSYGGAYIVMDSKKMGNDLCLAWPTAELAVMGAGQAAAILQRRATPEERAAFEADYSERLLNPYVAAERGYVDAVINPEETRREVSAALVMLRDKRERLAPRKHDNTPL
jgi:acetyl-CoA carboxylase carboxyltransferase component